MGQLELFLRKRAGDVLVSDAHLAPKEEPFARPENEPVLPSLHSLLRERGMSEPEAISTDLGTTFIPTVGAVPAGYNALADYANAFGSNQNMSQRLGNLGGGVLNTGAAALSALGPASAAGGALRVAANAPRVAKLYAAMRNYATGKTGWQAATKARAAANSYANPMWVARRIKASPNTALIAGYGTAGIATEAGNQAQQADAAEKAARLAYEKSEAHEEPRWSVPPQSADTGNDRSYEPAQVTTLADRKKDSYQF